MLIYCGNHKAGGLNRLRFSWLCQKCCFSETWKNEIFSTFGQIWNILEIMLFSYIFTCWLRRCHLFLVQTYIRRIMNNLKIVKFQKCISQNACNLFISEHKNLYVTIVNSPSRYYSNGMHFMAFDNKKRNLSQFRKFSKSSNFNFLWYSDEI